MKYLFRCTKCGTAIQTQSYDASCPKCDGKMKEIQKGDLYKFKK